MTVTTEFPDLDAEFATFDAENPHVWEHFERFTLMAIAASREHYSAEAIIQRIRWHLNVETKSEDGFRVNDHHRKRYALKFHMAHPEHNGFFRRREAGGGPRDDLAPEQGARSVGAEIEVHSMNAPKPATLRRLPSSGGSVSATQIARGGLRGVQIDAEALR